MSSVKDKFAIVISKIPMVQMGLGCMMQGIFLNMKRHIVERKTN